MRNLKSEVMNKCFSLLREFVNETPEINSRRGAAVLALDQLQRITAGTGGDGETDPELYSTCKGRPRADG